MRHRKEINDVTDQEFDRFAMALNQMKKDGNWTNIAKVHAASDKQHYKTHGDPKIFLPWHRKFFIEVENRLQIAAHATGLSVVDACSVTIPYWNWALDQSNFASARVWDSDRLGAIRSGVSASDIDEEFCVRDGKFGSQATGSEFGKAPTPFVGEDFKQEGCTQLHGNFACQHTIEAHSRGRGSDCIFRRGSTSFRPSLTYSQILTALRENQAYKGIDKYEDMATFIERELHNGVHGAIGGYNSWKWGHMAGMYSPYDPIFFFHHGFIDFLWVQWQEAHVESAWRNHRQEDMLNNLLFDGSTDTFSVSDVTAVMDIKDDDPSTDTEESACVHYHDRRTSHVCTSQWSEIQACLHNMVTYEKLHTVPRIRHMNGSTDICDPINKQHFDTDRMWLETMVASGMMQADHVDTVLNWERDQLANIENTTETLDEPDEANCDSISNLDAKAQCREAVRCDKALCFSATRLLQICSQCTADGWGRTCHCSEGMSPASCWESRD
jgi:tyrosinase